MPVLPAEGLHFEEQVPVVIVGAGCCGLVAALAAHDSGVNALVLERDASPTGSTSMSSGMIPAAGTRLQANRGIDDSPEIMAADIQRKAHGENDPALVADICSASGPVIDWLMDAHGVPFTLVEGFLYPGHSRERMHAPLSRSGADLMAALVKAAQASNIDILCHATVENIYAAADGRVVGVSFLRPDGQVERIGCAALVLSCSGYGGNSALVATHIPELASATYFGHAGNRGDALQWGGALGAATRHLGAYQGHGSLAMPHGILITWALMMEGGIQVNAEGRRFSNEHDGYSEQAVRVINQTGHVAWNIYDETRHAFAMDFGDYREAFAAGAIRKASNVAELAAFCHLPAAELEATLARCHALARGEGQDDFGRDFTSKALLTPPFYAVRVTGALFHTQGGLVVDRDARVLRPDGKPLPNLLAGGGAACGISGSGRDGYLSGNGLLTASVLGAKAGRTAARIAMSRG